MATLRNETGVVEAGIGAAGLLDHKSDDPKRVSPLEQAKQIAAGMVKSPKEMYWLGVRMENFLRANERRIDAVTVEVVCDYLETLLRKGLADWQVKQSLEAVGLLMR